MTDVKLRFQDPGADSGYLLEELLAACAGADGGGGIFAWANSPGARALLGDSSFRSLIEKGRFDLVVGLDSITDEAAVRALTEAEASLPNLSVRAFLNEESALFHPKMAWFRTGGATTLLVGSGNLTMGGLRGNWEFFVVAQLTGAQATQAMNAIEGWLEDWGDNLVPITDPRVIERARKNAGNERSLKRGNAPTKPAFAGAEAVGALIAEIPKAGDRWSQANFDLANYEGFFGAKVGTQRRVMLYQVTDDGRVGDLESRPSVEVISQNYRFELAAAKGVPYPDKSAGRPIGVFLKVATGLFLYMLVLPGEIHYSALADFLDSAWKGSDQRMRRIRLTVEELRAAWPKSPIWKARMPEL